MEMEEKGEEVEEHVGFSKVLSDLLLMCQVREMDYFHQPLSLMAYSNGKILKGQMQWYLS